MSDTFDPESDELSADSPEPRSGRDTAGADADRSSPSDGADTGTPSSVVARESDSAAVRDHATPEADRTMPRASSDAVSGETTANADSATSIEELSVDEFVEDESGDGLFDDLLAGDPIFENKEMLRPSYTPNELPHRSEQIDEMATILVSALRGDTPSNILIYGKTGTGKTASAKYVSRELEQTSEKHAVPCDVEYINCEVTDTQYRVLAQLANIFIDDNERRLDREIEAIDERIERAQSGTSGVFADTPSDSVSEAEDRREELRLERQSLESVPMTGWPTDRVYNTLFEAVDRFERVAVIMLDEIDKLVEKSGDDTLYNLSRMNTELENSRVSIIGISNDLKFTDFLDPRVKSSLGEEEIVFAPYDANQLRDILEHRADVAFKNETLSEDVIPLCAAFAAQEHGDARRALDLLRTAGELCERTQSERVQEQHVRKAQEKIELDRVVEVVRTLPTQSKLVLFAILLPEKRGVETVQTGEVYNIYKRVCSEIDADTLTQRRVTDLISELDMLGIVNAVVVSKGRYGRTKEIGLSVPLEPTEDVLRSDSRLSDVEDIRLTQSRLE